MTRLVHVGIAITLSACALILGGCSEELYTGLGQREATEMLVILRSNGIDAERLQTDSGYQLKVDSGNFTKSVAILSQAGYPKSSFQSMGQFFPGDRMIVSPFEQKVRFRYALEQELCKTLLTLSGVTDVSVHIVIPDRDIRGQPLTPPSGSVLAKLNSAADPAEVTAQIKIIVANAVDGLSYDRVAVVTDTQPIQLTTE